MKRRLVYIFSIVSIFCLSLLTSCFFTQSKTYPEASFSNLKYDTDTNTLTFDVNITDSSSMGSNYKLLLTDSNDETSVSKDLSDISNTISESFSGLTSGATYILKVTCEYDSNTNVIGSKYFVASTDTEANTTTTLGITYSDSTIEFDGSNHYLYAYYGSQAITENCTNTINNVTYYYKYDSANEFGKYPGSYTYSLNIYKVVGSMFNQRYQLLETLSATLTITKASTLYNFSDETLSYTGSDYVYPISVEGLTYSITDSNGDSSKAINPGTYTVSYNFTGNDYYEATSGNYILTITKGTIISYLTSQITTLEDGEANAIVDSSDFSVSGLSYSIKYYDLNNNELDKITETGTYIYEVTVTGNEYYETLVVSNTLYVVEDQDTSVIVSRVMSFSVETQNGRNATYNYYNYVELYNQNLESVDLSEITLTVDGTKIKLSSTLAGHSTYVVLVYSYAKTITFQSGYSRYQINFTDYADYSAKNTSATKLESITVSYNGIVNNYQFSTEYDDYDAILQYSSSNFKTNSFVYSYTNPSDIDSVIDTLKSYTYTNLAPSLIFNNTIETISETRISELYDVLAYDALGNEIIVDASCVDTSLVCADNVGKTVTITYTIKDSYGNTTTRTRQVVVVDEEAPTVELNEGQSLSVELNANINLLNYFYVTDAHDGDIEVTSDMISTELDTSIAGAYKVVLSVSDKAGNVAEYTITIRVGITYSYLDTIVSQTVKTKDTGEANAMPSSGNVKVLVVPISFANESSSSISTIEACFNGNSTKLATESVSSYYQKSSYSKLNLSFDVYSSWIQMPKKYTYYDSNIKELISYALSYVSKSYDLSKYDSDSDGYIDSIWFIYDINYDSDTNYFWAWTSDLSSYSLSYDNKSVGKVAFASLEFSDSSDSYYQSFNEYQSGKYTARTYIHETGHLLGLEDYYDYDYDYSVGVSHNMYGQSMMDENIGDLDAASKLLLGWVNPIVVSETDTVTIGSTAKSSDNVILISKNIESKKTIFTEYILLEFWTSDCLNAYDASKSFGTNAYGIRVLHLDATINYVNGKATLTTGSRPSYYKYNNTDDDTKNFLETLAVNPSSIYNSKTKTYNVKNNVLFTDTTKVFGKDYYSSFTYNDSTKLDFTFQITDLTNSSATIQINF